MRGKARKISVAAAGRIYPAMILLCLLLLAAPIPGEAASTGNATEISLPDTPDSTRLLVPFPFFSTVGLQAGFVSTRELDTGVDFGALLGKDFYRDFLEVTTTAHLWGATNDTLDVATAAVDLGLLYKIPIRTGLFAYAGFVLGYGFVHSEETHIVNGTVVSAASSDYDFQKFVTAGAECDIHGNRTLFLQVKYGTTHLARELHVTGGMNFYTKYKKFIPWLAPPLMRD